MPGDLNTNMVEPERIPKGEAIADKLVLAGLMDMVLHFLPHHEPQLQNRCTWSMRRDG